MTEIKIAEGPVRAILAPNPSPLTGGGTNTYVLGEGRCVVIDPGPESSQHLEAVLGCLAPTEVIEAVVVTHPHLDHTAGVPALVAATGARVYGFGGARDGRSALMRARFAENAATGAGADLSFAPDYVVADGAQLQVGAVSLRVLHTPGHMGAHICLAWGRALFSGDHVMGWAPSLVAPPEGDMGAYMASLARLADEGWDVFLPGHGAPIWAPAERILELQSHRRLRESQVRAALAGQACDLAGLRRKIYPALDPILAFGAEANLLAHLLDLQDRDQIPLNHWAARLVARLLEKNIDKKRKKRTSPLAAPEIHDYTPPHR